MNDNYLISFLAVLALIFLLAWQKNCVEFEAANDAYYLEKLRIEEGLKE